MCWWMINGMECEWCVYQAESSSKVSVQGEDNLGRIGLKENVDFQLFVELRGRQWEERVVGLSRWRWKMSTQMFGQWIPESGSLVVEGSVCNFEPRWIGRTLEGDNCRLDLRLAFWHLRLDVRDLLTALIKHAGDFQHSTPEQIPHKQLRKAMMNALLHC